MNNDFICFFLNLAYLKVCPGFEISIPNDLEFNDFFFFQADLPACQDVYKSGTS